MNCFFQMALTESRPLFIRLTLPDGLEEALEGLAREVLRHQPENILDFAANHFDQLLKKRGTSGTLDIWNWINIKRDYVAKKTGDLENGTDNELQSLEDEDGIELENIEGKYLIISLNSILFFFFWLCRSRAITKGYSS